MANDEVFFHLLKDALAAPGAKCHLLNPFWQRARRHHRHTFLYPGREGKPFFPGATFVVPYHRERGPHWCVYVVRGVLRAFKRSASLRW